MPTRQPNPHFRVNEYISGKMVFDPTTKHYVSPALNVSNNFATSDYDAHINTRRDYTINHIFRFMTVQELDTLHTLCELERINTLQYLLCLYKPLNSPDSF